jgi:hypothetical protein
MNLSKQKKTVNNKIKNYPISSWYSIFESRFLAYFEATDNSSTRSRPNPQAP